MTKLTLRCVHFSPVRSGTLLGFAVVEIVELKMCIHKIPIYFKDGKQKWAGLPAAARTYAHELVRVDNRVIYDPLVTFDDKRVQRAFSDRVIEAVKEYDERIFDNGDQQDDDGENDPFGHLI